MNKTEMKPTIVETNYLCESSQRELEAYRKLRSACCRKRLNQQKIRRKKIFKLILQVIANFVLQILLALDIWVFLSWVDIVLHNTQENPVYQIWNFFTMLS